MSEHKFGYELQGTCSNARAGLIHTAHGVVQTPAFMTVGTYGAVRGLSPEGVRGTGAQIILSNTLHLYLRPGLEVIDLHGGLHNMMGWDGPILTDSGGFQLMSLQSLLKIDDEGVDLRSPVDGGLHRYTPELVMDIQRRLGVDIAMVLDHCPAADAEEDFKRQAMDRSTRWAAQCLTQPRAPGQAVFGIVQGGVDLDLRREHLAAIAELEPDGLALGGLAVGEGPVEMDRVVSAIAPEMPAHKPRYLMGVGFPRDLVASVRGGIDLFDCVIPTRHARNGQMFTAEGKINIANSRFRTDDQPPDPGCDCATCQRFTRSYLRHLYTTKEILYSTLATQHNLRFYQRLMASLRQAILDDDQPRLDELSAQF